MIDTVAMHSTARDLGNVNEGLSTLHLLIRAWLPIHGSEDANGLAGPFFLFVYYRLLINSHRQRVFARLVDDTP